MSNTVGLRAELHSSDGSRSFNGMWHLPSSPEREVRGVLTIDDGESMTLDLFGGALMGPSEDGNPPYICGRSDDGAKITCLDAYRVSTKSRQVFDQSGDGVTEVLSRQTWRMHEVMIGKHFFNRTEDLVSFLHIQTQKLHEWVGPLQTRRDEVDNSISITVDLPQRADFVIENVRGSIGWFEAGSHSSFYEESVSIAASLEVSLTEPVALSSAWDEWVAPLVLFVLFSHGEKDKLQSLHITTGQEIEVGASSSKSFEWIQTSWRGKAPDSKAIWIDQHLLPFTEVSKDVEGLLGGWLSLYKTARFPLMQYLAPRLSDSEPFLEEGFAARVRSLESFHRDIHGGTFMDSGEYAELLEQIMAVCGERRIDAGNQRLRDFIGVRLRHANQLSLKRRLDMLLDDSGTLLQSDGESWRAGHRRIVATRDSLVHSSSLGGEMTLEQVAKTLTYLDELFQASVLRALGLDEAAVDSALGRRPTRRFRIPSNWSF